MRILLVAGAALALSACSTGTDTDTANQTNTLAADNATIEPAAPMNGTMDMGANGSVDANTQELMEKDAVTNDPDTNLANGL